MVEELEEVKEKAFEESALAVLVDELLEVDISLVSPISISDSGMFEVGTPEELELSNENIFLLLFPVPKGVLDSPVKLKGDGGVCVGVEGLEPNFPFVLVDMLDFGWVLNGVVLDELDVAPKEKAEFGAGVEEPNIEFEVPDWGPVRKDGA